MEPLTHPWNSVTNLAPAAAAAGVFLKRGLGLARG